MTGKQNAVFWLGLAMILLNFWLAGQSTIIWNTIAGTGSKNAKKVTTPKAGNAPHPGVKPSPKTPDPHGFVQ
jgi:hypothetical protein